jgi:short-subunit dehydrogenase
MASRGAKNLILLSRTGATRESAMELVADLEAKQVNVATPPCDVTNAETLESALNKCLTHMPPIKGCIQGSMVLKVYDLKILLLVFHY